jgi:D-amino peptidase
MQRCATLRIGALQTPAALRLEATAVAIADLFALLPFVRRVDAVTIEWTSPTMRHAVRILNSLSAMSAAMR